MGGKKLVQQHFFFLLFFFALLDYSLPVSVISVNPETLSELFFGVVLDENMCDLSV